MSQSRWLDNRLAIEAINAKTLVTWTARLFAPNRRTLLGGRTPAWTLANGT